jgi:hypothetical protein
MTLNERILDFLDGSLPPDDEAELLHTLSVSPEKRNMLRSFMKQDALLASDRASLAIPYRAEQGLWAKLDAVMPASPVVRGSDVLVRQPGFFSRLTTGATAMVGALALLVGVGAGYYAGAQKPAVEKQVVVYRDANPAIAAVAPGAHSQANGIVRLQPVYMAALPMLHVGGPLNSATPSEPVAVQELAVATPSASVSSEPTVSTVSPRPTESIAMSDIGDDGIIKPMLRRTPQDFRAPEKTLLQRFEFALDESFGKQFPNSAATDASLPLITNTSLSAYFQVLPHSNLLWVGGAYGTANVTVKDLYDTRVSNSIDPLQHVLASDTVHSQTSYVAALAELRLPAFPNADLTFTAGYGFASLGKMMIGQLGLHYDVSREVGIRLGFRALRFTYDLSDKLSTAINSSTGSLVIPRAVGEASPSFTTEFNTGLYFHF